MRLSSLLLPMNALYKNPDLRGFNEAKQNFLKKKLTDDYFLPNQSIENKWDFLMNAFKSQLDSTTQLIFTNFQNARKQVMPNRQSILQLEQLMVYFEHFYFFYYDRSYALTNPSKF